MKKHSLHTVFLDTLPVMTGYLFLGTGFGILLNEAGYGIGWAFTMSLFIYAGSLQFLAVSLLSTQATLLSTALATLLVNARHIFYGISLVEAYRDIGREKPYMIFALTDETYSLVTANTPPQGMSRRKYCFLVSLLDHVYWVAGSVIGSVLGKLLPISFEGVEFVLTALFVTIFTEQWLSSKNHFPAVTGICATLLCLLLFGRDVFLVPAMLLIAILLTVTQKTGRGVSHE